MVRLTAFLLSMLVISSCEASVLPRAKLCVKQTDFGFAVSKVGGLMESYNFELILDSSKAENIKNIPPRFLHWQRMDGMNLSLDDYTNEGYILVNVYEQKKKFSGEAVIFYESLADDLKAIYGKGKVQKMLSPKDINEGKTERSCGITE